ncbi:primosomal protein N' [Thauera sp. 28]|uniref:primosomal protein N' n=1 Tax=unclassified Thauera TaxID=2609274 RepID=UPI0002CF8B87|nr:MULTISPECIES: primosomal protein N' [unclassified Thauera]ENO93698.1 primosomal protein N' [Thauera sp. 28]WBL64232.1 primosomal protein N' [Thauera sp. WB-2]HNR60142.1 primosomal protein N' [Thauera sp.]HNS91705.1 primosomal protein N' [Thauera sp.]
MTIVRVALPVPLPQVFDYAAADATEADVGRCVKVPFGRGDRNGLIVALGNTADVEPARIKTVHHIQREVPALPADWLALVDFVARYYHAPLGEVVALALPPGLRRADGVSDADEDPLLEIGEAGRRALADARRPSKALMLLQALAAEPGPWRRSVIRAMAGGEAVGDVLRRGWLTAIQDEGRVAALASGAQPELTAEQARAIEAIVGGGAGFRPWLLHGVTGSGKTEVYLRLAAHALAQGQQVLMLVPEIALTPQLEQRVAQRFAAANVVSLHSALADGARSRGFVQALTGRADIVLGTRLAVFAPLPRLGLILVDEEHDASYKQQEGVRYSARDVAVWRARQRGVPIVLGSATPSLETWYHARSERYALQTLSQRAVAATLPAVHCIDTRRLKLDEGLSPGLQAAIGQRLERGEQSLVFLNRRGYAPVLSCPSCGWVSRCPHCSANLVVHLADRRLRCHHCGCDGSIPHACPSCGNQDIQPFGRGTQRIEARLAERFPQARVLRVDRDAARTRAQWEKLLDTIAAGEADILVGTQMMAKGHDFPRLTLVGVIGADASLHAADFRAPERLFQQLMQVGGRAGRGTLPGTVLIQTEYPGHPLYQHLGRHDFDAFARMALQERRSAGFPPFTHQAMLRADAPALDDAVEFLRHARRLAEALAPEGLRLYDPVPMRMTRLARRERAQLLIEADQRGLLQAFLLSWIEMLYRQRTARELRWQIDVDPLEV